MAGSDVREVEITEQFDIEIGTSDTFPGNKEGHDRHGVRERYCY